MTDRSELVAQIRFALSNLRAKNGHHEFEHMCREVARQKVTPNILPATGPVAGSGDQGRDFESFRSRLTPRLGETALFLGLDGQDLTAFACTLQQDRVLEKLAADIKTVCSDGEPVAAIVGFCEADVPVGQRHALKARVRKRWNVALELFDGAALADVLADESLFWVATRYLSISAALVPEPAVRSSYDEALERWHSRGTPASSLGDYIALRRGLRHATFDRDRRSDVEFWLSRIRLLADSDTAAIARLASYEVILGTLRGIGHLRGAENARLVRDLLSRAEDSSDESELEDAAIILINCAAAWSGRLIDTDNVELMRWSQALRDRITALLATDLDDGRRCVLLSALGSLCLQPDISDGRQAASPMPVDIDHVMELVERREPGDPTMLVVDAGAAVDAWLALARLLERNWLFPIDSLATRLTMFAPLISRSPGYEELTQLVDEAVRKRSGDSAVAELCRGRALAHAKQGRMRDALVEFHRARVSWLTGDEIRGSLFAQHFAARCYEELKLPLAARYFWLASAWLAARDEGLADLIPQALCGAAGVDYESGSWFGALELTEIAFVAQAVAADDPWDLERYEYLQPTVFNLAVLDGLAGRFGAAYAGASATVIDRFEIRPFLDAMTPGDPWWATSTENEITDHVVQELGWEPFADAGPNRVITWSALGIEWRMDVPNAYRAVLAAERLATIMQVAAAELSRYELMIAPTRVRMHVTLNEQGTGGHVDFQPSNNGRDWAVALDANPATDQVAFSDAVVILLEVLSDVSLLPSADLNRLVTRALAEGLIERFAPMLPYDRIVPIGETRFEQSGRARVERPSTQETSPPEHADLRWRDTVAPEYSEEEGKRLARSRYERMRYLLPYSIPRLMTNGTVRATCEALRVEGWKDWHLLQALTSIIMSHRLTLSAPRSTREVDEANRRISETPETETDMTPSPAAVSISSMKSALGMSMLVTVRHLGLEVRQQTPDFPAIERLLAKRYRFWDDDADHDRWWEVE